MIYRNIIVDEDEYTKSSINDINKSMIKNKIPIRVKMDGRFLIARASYTLSVSDVLFLVGSAYIGDSTTDI